MGDNFDEYDYLEDALENATKGKDEGGDKEPDRKKRSRSRSRDRRRRERDQDEAERRRKDDEEKGSKRRDRRRSRSRERPASGSKERKEREIRERDNRPPRRERTPPEVREQRERDKELEALDRDTRTVFAYNLPIKGDERDIFEFFSKAGRVNDVRIICDRHTKRSKGFAYVEMADRADVLNAVALTGQPLKGQQVMVKMSEAEKNLAWEASQQAAISGKTDPVQALGPGPITLAVANVLLSLTEADLAPIFAPFGTVMNIKLIRDAVGNSAGRAYVKFSSSADAARAMADLNGLDLAGQRLKITIVPPGTVGGGKPKGIPGFLQTAAAAAAGLPGAAGAMLPGTAPNALASMPNAMSGLGGSGAMSGVGSMAGLGAMGMGGTQMGMPGMMPGDAGNAGMMGMMEQDNLAQDDARGGLRLTSQSRAALMSRLAQGAGLTVPETVQFPPPPVAQQAGPVVDPSLSLEQGMLGPASPIPTPCLLLKNMFDPAEETEPNWDLEICEDVKAECSKYGEVVHAYVDRNSKGFVYLKFVAPAGAAAAQAALNGRWFAGKRIAADFQFLQPYNQHFGL